MPRRFLTSLSRQGVCWLMAFALQPGCVTPRPRAERRDGAAFDRPGEASREDLVEPLGDTSGTDARDEGGTIPPRDGSADRPTETSVDGGGCMVSRDVQNSTDGVPNDSENDASADASPDQNDATDVLVFPCDGAGLVRCGDQCTNLATDPLNCGVCGASCLPGTTCREFMCECPEEEPPARFRQCRIDPSLERPVRCTDVFNDRMHCGGCTEPGGGPNPSYDGTCLPPRECRAGVCTCPDPYRECDGRCIDPNANDCNCGGCGERQCDHDASVHSCIEGRSCVAGVCRSVYPVGVAVGESDWCAVMSEEIGTSSGTRTVRCSRIELFPQWSVNLTRDVSLRGVTYLSMGAPRCFVRSGGWTSCDGGDFGSGEGVFGADVVEIVTREGIQCLRRSDGTVWCRGRPDHNDNRYGQLGDGRTDSHSDFRLVDGLHDVAQIAVGNGFVCARIRNGTVQCWGKNDSGQIGMATTNRCSEPARPDGTVPQVACSLRPVEVPCVSEVADLAVGLDHVCVLFRTGFVRCWGNGTRGQLGPTVLGPNWNGSPVFRVQTATRIAAGDNFTCALIGTSNVIQCWGDPAFGSTQPTPLNFGPVTSSPVVQLAAGGGQSVCAIVGTGDRTLYCGLIGDGGTLRRIDFPR